MQTPDLKTFTSSWLRREFLAANLTCMIPLSSRFIICLRSLLTGFPQVVPDFGGMGEVGMETDTRRNKLPMYNESFCSAPPLVESNKSLLEPRATARASEGTVKSKDKIQGSDVKTLDWI